MALDGKDKSVSVNQPNIKKQELKNIKAAAKSAVEAESIEELINLLQDRKFINYILEVVINHGTSEIIELIIDQVPNSDRQQTYDEGLYFAVKAKHKIALGLLLARGANINTTQRKKRNTPLHTAIIQNCSADLVIFLLENGADPKITNEENKTVLDLVKESCSRNSHDDEIQKIADVIYLHEMSKREYKCMQEYPDNLNSNVYQMQVLTLYAIINTELAVSKSHRYELGSEVSNALPFDDIFLKKKILNASKVKHYYEFVQVKQTKKPEQNKLDISKFFFGMHYKIYKSSKVQNIKHFLKGYDSIVKIFIKFNKIVDSFLSYDDEGEFIYFTNMSFKDSAKPYFEKVKTDLFYEMELDKWKINPEYLSFEFKFVLLNLVSECTKKVDKQFANNINDVLNTCKSEEHPYVNENTMSTDKIAGYGLKVIELYIQQLEGLKVEINSKESKEDIINLDKITRNLFMVFIPEDLRIMKKDAITHINKLKEKCNNDKEIFNFFFGFKENYQMKEKIHKFVKLFSVFTNCPSSDGINETITRKIKEIFSLNEPKFIAAYCLNHFEELIKNIKTDKTIYFTEENGKQLFNDIRMIKSNKMNTSYINEIENKNIAFKKDNHHVINFLHNDNNDKILHVIVQSTRVHAMHISQTVKNLNYPGTLCTNSDNLFKYDKIYLKLNFELIVLEVLNTHESVKLSVCIKDIIETKVTKKLIIISKGTLTEILNDEHVSCESSIEFTDMEEKSQDYILDKSVNFRNNPTESISDMKIKDFFSIPTNSNVIDEVILAAIISSNKDLNIGNSEAFISDSYVKDYFMPRYVLKNEMEFLTHSDDEELLNYKLEPNNITDKVVLIANNPGEGKSTMLTHLAHSMIGYNNWIIRVDLRKYTDNDLVYNLKAIKFGVDDTNKAVEFICLMVAKGSDVRTKLESKLLQHTLVTGGEVKVILLFDGFDEISPHYKENTCILLNALANSKVKQLWVTTRVHMKEYLEERLHVVAYRLKSFNTHEQVEFLCKFWTFQMKDTTDEETIAKIVKQAKRSLYCLSISVEDGFESILKQIAVGSLSTLAYCTQHKDFLRVPLHLFMLAKTAMIKSFNISSLAKLTEVYSEFVQNIFEEYENKSGSKSGNIVDIDINEMARVLYRKMHCEVAVTTLFEIEPSDSLPDLDICHENSLEMLTRGGLIKAYGSQKEFVHRTFAEYFFSEYVEDNLIHPIIQSKFLAKILLDDDFELVRTFFDGFLSRRPLLNRSKKNRNRDIGYRRYPYQNIICQNVLEEIVHKGIDPEKTILRLTIKEDNVHIFVFLFNNIPRYQFLTLFKDLLRDGYLVLPSAIQETHKKSRMFNVILDSINSIEQNSPELESFAHNVLTELLMQHRDSDNILHIAAIWNLDGACFTKLMKNHKNDIHMLLLESNSAKFSVLHIVAQTGNRKLCKVILKLAKECFGQSERDVRDSNSNDSFHNFTLKLDMSKRNALHVAASQGNVAICRLIMLTTGKNKDLFKDLIMQQDNLKYNILHMALSADDLSAGYFIVKWIIKEHLYKLLYLISQPTRLGSNIVHAAALNRDTTKYVEWIFNTVNQYTNISDLLKNVLLQGDCNGYNTLHMALDCENGPLCFTIMIAVVNNLDVLRSLLTQRTLKNETAFHLATTTGQFGFFVSILEFSKLLEGVFVNTITEQNLQKKTCLHLAAIGGYLKICDIILKTAERAQDQLVKFLILQEDENKETAFHLAARHGHAKVCDLLLNTATEYADIAPYVAPWRSIEINPITINPGRYRPPNTLLIKMSYEYIKYDYLMLSPYQVALKEVVTKGTTK